MSACWSPAEQAASCRSSASIPVWSGKATGALRLARRVRGRVAPGKPDRPRGLHALQRLHPRLPRGRDRLRLPGRSREVQGAPRLRRRPAATSARSTSRARRATRQERFDLVLDLSREPLIRLHELPQGYFAPGDDPLEQALAAQKLVALVGEFEKPRFFQYREKICAHSRSGQRGLQRSASTSARAARSAPTATTCKVEPHLCAGCGGCATVCPSGAMTYVYPKVPDMGLRLKTMLATYREAGGKDACILFHDARDGRARAACARAERQGPAGARDSARVLPRRLDRHGPSARRAWPTARAQVGVLCDREDRRRLCRGAQAADGLCADDRQRARLRGNAFLADREPGRAVGARRRRRRVAKPATFNLSSEKRTTLDFAIDHLARDRRVEEIMPLPAGAPFGALAVNKQTCTLCKACIGACPESALIDSHRDAEPALHRAQLRAVRAVREYLPGGRDRARSAAAARTRKPRRR